jgi:hypothetical protein
MRSQSLAQLLSYEAKRRPEIAELISRVSTMSDDDIDALDLPLPWFKQALKQERGTINARKMIDDNVVFGETENQDGVIWEWISDAMFVPVGNGAIEIKMGDLILITEKGFWLGSSLYPPCPIDLTQKCRKIGPSAYSEFRSRVRDKLMGNLPPERTPLFVLHVDGNS